MDEVAVDIYGKPVCAECGRLAVEEGIETTPVPTGPRLTDRWNRTQRPAPKYDTFILPGMSDD